MEDPTEKAVFALSVVNDVIFTKLVTIFAAVLDAAAINAKAPNWIVLNRIIAKSPAAELLLEAAMGQTSSRPVVAEEPMRKSWPWPNALTRSARHCAPVASLGRWAVRCVPRYGMPGLGCCGCCNWCCG